MARVLAIDIGTSSIRATLYGPGLKPAGHGTQVHYRWRIGSDGSVEAAAATLERAVATAIDGALAHARSPVDAVAIAAFWHSLLGVDRHERPLTSVIPWTDTRSSEESIRLRSRLDERRVHARTGCRIHPTYWPARIRWFADREAKTFRRVRRWTSFPAYLERRWLGRDAESRSQASGTGLFVHDDNGWDRELCEACDISTDHLAPVVDLDDGSGRLSPSLARRWPALANARWVPAAGDGALNCLGAGCQEAGDAALMIGTSGALRELWTTDKTPKVPFGLWRYWLDRRRVVVGGALSNGGNFVAWMRQTMGFAGNARDAARLDNAIARMPPDVHGLTVLPFAAGERSPHYPADAVATFTGVRLATRREDILRAGLEGIAYRFLAVLEDLVTVVPVNRLTATGTALTASRVWPQILADVLGRDVAAMKASELTSRGAAILAFEQLGMTTPHPPPPVARVFRPNAAATATYRAAADRQRRLLEALT